MGIILKESKLLFDELIGSNSFDEIFKNSIRDYYTYGFKSYEQFSKANRIVRNRWKIFYKILGEKWYFEERKGGRNQIVLKTTPVGGENPVDDFYFLHNLSKIGDYLNYLIDMDRRSTLRRGISVLPKEIQNMEIKDEVELSVIYNWLNQLKNGINKTEEEFSIRISRQLNLWSPSTRYRTADSKNKYANLNERMEYLSGLGVVWDLRETPEKRNRWLKKQWENLNLQTKKFSDEKVSGDHFWYKSPLTMEAVCEKVCGDNDAEKQLFLEKFSAMCDFFSQYNPVGELGTMLLKRCSCKVKDYDRSIFKFKHNYLQKSLYDYNLIDILIAIEKQYWCLIEYSHGLNMKSYEEMIVPLEIRISVINGREYVMYYHVRERRISALRLEFIDKITIYSSVESIQRIKCRIKKSGKKIQRTNEKIEEIFWEKEEIKKQTVLAKQMLPYIWGTEVSECEVTENWREKLIRVDLPVVFEKESEKYIEHRLKKENRTLANRIEQEVFPTKELRNWIRSFYKRLDVAEDDRIGEFHVSEDVNAMWNVYFGKKKLQGDGAKEYKRRDDTEYVKYTYQICGTTVSATEGHSALFHELFSNYAIVLADTVLECSGKETSADVRQVLNEKVSNMFCYYSKRECAKVCDDLEMYIRSAELIDADGKTRFILEHGSYLFDVLPLTKMELRWLLTVLEDPVASIFLSEKQIKIVKNFIQKTVPFQIAPFAMKSIYYFDQYNLEKDVERHSPKEIGFIKKIYQAILSEEKLKIRMENWEGTEKEVYVYPVWIEYSRRDDVFRLWHVKKDRIQIINLQRVLEVTVLKNKKYRRAEHYKTLNTLYDHTFVKMKVEFYQGERNLPDRLLTEFSLWKKKCIYDVVTQKYTMHLTYSTLDEKEILIRLMSYGPYVRVVESENSSEDQYILAELKKRIIEQRDKIQEKEIER